MLVSSNEREENFRFCANVFDCWWTCADLSSKYIVEHLSHILFSLKIDPVEILNQKEKEITVVQLLR